MLKGRRTFLLAALLAAGPVAAQQTAPAPPPATRGAGGDSSAVVILNFPADVELRVIVEYVAQRLGLNVLHDEQLAGKRVSLTSPARVSVDALPELLDSVLAMKGLALIDAGAPGWKRVVAAGEAGGEVGIEFVPVLHADAPTLAEQLRPVLAASGRPASVLPGVGNAGGAPRGLVRNPDWAVGGGVPATQPGVGGGVGVDVSFDPRTNQLILVGPAAAVARARQVIRRLDVPLAQAQSPIRFFKLANATAADVLDTIRSLEGDSSATGGDAGVGGAERDRRRPGSTFAPAPSGRTRTSARPGSSGSSQSPADGGLRSQSGTSGFLSAPSAGGPSSASSLLDGDRGTGISGFAGGTSGQRAQGTPAPRGAGQGSGAAGGIRSGDATVTADTNTNTIIVVGPPAAQRAYETLIRELDRRRPQVLIESTIVTIDTGRDFQLGVEVAARRRGDESQQIVFSSFGLSTVDAATGRLAPLPGLGLNAAILNADVADVVLRALAANRRSKIVASPRVLVNDNATGALFSIAESPFTSVNAGETIATTSFGGYAEAGTEITLTPHISEADYLQLEYEVALSSFTGQPSDQGIPPPRQTDKVASEVTVPDGSTIVVGGLNRTQSRDAVNAVPILSDIPLIGNLFRSRTEGNSSTTLFVFIRPTILRDDQFRDLRFLSERDVQAAGLPDGFPSSEPMVVE